MFCMYCGKPLEEGQICSCQAPEEVTDSVAQPEQQVAQTDQSATQPTQSQPAQPQPEQPQPEQPQPEQPQTAQLQFLVQVQQTGNVYQGQPMNQGNGLYVSQYQQQFEKVKQKSTIFLQKVYIAFKSILYSPATEGSKFAASENTTIAMGLLAFQGLFSAIFALVVSTNINSLYNIAYSYGKIGNNIARMYKMPLFKIFIVTIIISVALSFALATLLYIAGMLFKNTISFKAAFCIVAIRSTIIIPISISSIVLFNINSSIGLTIFYLGSLAGLCYMVSASSALCPESKDRIPAIVFTAALIFVFVASFVMYKSVSNYLPESMKDDWGHIKDVITNPINNILDGMLGNGF